MRTSVLLSVKWALGPNSSGLCYGIPSCASLPQYIPQPGFSQRPHPHPSAESSHPLIHLGLWPCPPLPGSASPNQEQPLSWPRLTEFQFLAGKDTFYRCPRPQSSQLSSSCTGERLWGTIESTSNLATKSEFPASGFRAFTMKPRH